MAAFVKGRVGGSKSNSFTHLQSVHQNDPITDNFLRAQYSSGVMRGGEANGLAIATSSARSHHDRPTE